MKFVLNLLTILLVVRCTLAKECELSSDCSPNHACINRQCKSPCVDVCNTGAVCFVENHNPICMCRNGYTGNPFDLCVKIIHDLTDKETECGQCGSFASCKHEDNLPVCRCDENASGSPPNCRKKCSTSSECAVYEACADNKCEDPCEDSNVCSEHASCNVYDHQLVCKCNEGYSGDPFYKCLPQLPGKTGCGTCGPFSACKKNNDDDDSVTCECLGIATGSPPNCIGPECILNVECSRDKACINSKCTDPCSEELQACADGASCSVKNRNPICTCKEGFSGDPFIKCLPQQPENPPEKN